MLAVQLPLEGAIAWRKCQQWGFFMLKLINSYLRDESGAAAAEYALILTIIGTAVYLGIQTLGNDISTALTNAGIAVTQYTY
jgi:pilus assembly protein Flp/PilA